MDHSTCPLAFDGQCLEAFAHYAELLGGSVETLSLQTAQAPLVEFSVLRVGDWAVMGHDRRPGDGTGEADVALMVCSSQPEEAWSLYRTLAKDGHITTPMHESTWARVAGGLIDRYGTAWIICHGIRGGSARLLIPRPQMTLDVLPLHRHLMAGDAPLPRACHTTARS